MPAKSYLGSKSEDIDDDEPKAEKLLEVHSKEDGEESLLSTDVDWKAGGVIKVKNPEVVCFNEVETKKIKQHVPTRLEHLFFIFCVCCVFLFFCV